MHSLYLSSPAFLTIETQHCGPSALMYFSCKIWTRSIFQNHRDIVLFSRFAGGLVLENNLSIKNETSRSIHHCEARHTTNGIYLTEFIETNDQNYSSLNEIKKNNWGGFLYFDLIKHSLSLGNVRPQFRVEEMIIILPRSSSVWFSEVQFCI